MTDEHLILPALVFVPLAASALLVIWRRRWVERLLMLAVPVATTGVAGWLLAATRHSNVLVTNIGGYPAVFAINLVADSLAAVLLVVMSAMTVVAAVMLTLTGEDRRRFVPPLVLLLHTGVNGALMTADLFNLFVFIEVMLMPSYALIAATGTWRRLGIGRLFLLVNIMTGTWLLISVGFVYGVTGTVNLAALAESGMEDRRAAAALGLVLFTLAVKAGAFPVHGWLPRAYAGTSGAMMTLFSALHTKIALYAIYRIYAIAFGGPGPVLTVIAVVAMTTMIAGAIASYGEVRVRGVLAYQMISGVGHILLGLAVFTELSLGAGLFYMTHHIITMAGLLTCAAALEFTYGSGRLTRLGGLMRREKVLAGCMAIGMLSLVGVPTTSGTWGKMALVSAVAAMPRGGRAAFLGAIIVASIASLLALQYLWREVFWGPLPHEYLPDDPKKGRGDPQPLTDEVRVPTRLKAVPVVVTAAVVALFFVAGPVLPVFTRAGHALADTLPYITQVMP